MDARGTETYIVRESHSNMRLIVRQSFSGRWGSAALGTLVYAAAIIIPAMILLSFQSGFSEFLYYVYMFIICGPLTMGYSKFIMDLVRGNGAKIGEIFSGFERFGKSVGLYVMRNILIGLWSLPSVIFMIVMLVVGILAAPGMFYYGSQYTSDIAVGYMFLIVIGSIALMIPAYMAMYRYFFAFYAMIDEPELGVMAAIRRSKELTKGNKWRLFVLNLTFIGWTILGALSCGIGLLWVMPYMIAATVIFYELSCGRLKINDSRAPITERPEMMERPEMAAPAPQLGSEQQAVSAPQLSPDQPTALPEDTAPVTPVTGNAVPETEILSENPAVLEESQSSQLSEEIQPVESSEPLDAPEMPEVHATPEGEPAAGASETEVPEK